MLVLSFPRPCRILVRSRFAAILLIAILQGVVSSVFPNGINRNGVGARSIALGGASVADVHDTFTAATKNPALFGFSLSDDFVIGMVGVIADGSFENGGSRPGSLDEDSGFFPEIAVRRILRKDLVLGFSLVPEQARVADWVYEDLPGGADGSTSYGVHTHRSEIIGLRGALSLGWQISDTLSLGAAIGVVHNRNGLVSPYTFQSHPSLAGFKTLLNLETEGYGANADVGLAWRPDESLTLAVSYRTPTPIETQGSASGDLREQFDNLGLAAPSTFRYDAEVANEFPDILSAGLSWQATEKTRLSLQCDLIGWSDSFDSLTVRLDHGSNGSINGLLGDDGIVDTIPLDWKDRFVFRAGVDHQIANDWSLRMGYSHGHSPVPDSTLTPMTAAISEHAVAFGVGHVRGPLSIDLAYQIDLPESRTGTSASILSGEYAGTTIDLTTHWIALTVGYEF